MARPHAHTHASAMARAPNFVERTNENEQPTHPRSTGRLFSRLSSFIQPFVAILSQLVAELGFVTLSCFWLSQTGP